MASDTARSKAPHRLKMSTKLFYGLGSVAFGVKDNGYSYLLLIFYNQVVGLPATWVGLALLGALAFDAVIDPLIGAASDRLHSPLGRRHPFMYAAAVPVTIAYFALWSPPDIGKVGQFAYLVALTLIVRTFISLYEVPSSALAAELTQDYDERSSLLSYRFFFGWVGGLTVQALAFAVFLASDARHPVGQLNPEGYARYGAFAAGVIFVAIVVSALGTHSLIPSLAKPPKRAEGGWKLALAEARQTLSNRSFLFVMASSVAVALGLGLTASLNTYFNTYFWGFSSRDLAILTLSVFAAAFAALGLGPRASRRFGKRATFIGATVLATALGLAPILLRLAGLFPPNHSPRVLAILIGTSISGVTCAIIGMTMTNSMIADVVEASELETGRRDEGLFFAAAAFGQKAVSGLGLLGGAAVIEFVKLKPGMAPSQVPPETLARLGEVYCPVLALVFGIGVLLALGYKITRAGHAETLMRLAAAAEQVREPMP